MGSRSRSRSPLDDVIKRFRELRGLGETVSNAEPREYRTWWATEWSAGGGGWSSGQWKPKARWENHFDLWWTELYGIWWTEVNGVWIRYSRWKEIYDMIKKDKAATAAKSSTSSTDVPVGNDVPKPKDDVSSEESSHYKAFEVWTPTDPSFPGWSKDKTSSASKDATN